MPTRHNVPGDHFQGPSFREDIQALRGLAILLVLLHHAKLDIFKAGYLGVDIFFVISGYLITQIIRKDLENGTFSLKFRRLRSHRKGVRI